MTETGAGAVVAANEEPRHIGTYCFGRPARGCGISHRRRGRIAAEQGELLVRHAGADPRYGFFREYLKDPDATAEAWEGGWFHTGDVVRRGPDGSLHFVDRRKNVIRRSGENIAAVEVESALRQHPAVAAVAVAPDRRSGARRGGVCLHRCTVTAAMQALAQRDHRLVSSSGWPTTRRRASSPSSPNCR